MTSAETALNRNARSGSGSSMSSASTAAIHNRSEYGSTISASTTASTSTSATSTPDSDCARTSSRSANGFATPMASARRAPYTPASAIATSVSSALKASKRRPLPLKQRTSSVDTRRDVTSNTWRSLLVLIKPREYFVTVDHFSIWRRHLAWAMESGKDLRTYMTQRYASNMVFMSLLLSTELGVLFNSAPLTTNMRMQLQAGNHHSVEFYAGFMLLISALLTILGLLSTFTAWAMVNAVDENNAHCIFRSSIGQYAAELPGRFIVCSIYSFLVSFWLFFFLLLPVGFWSLSLLTVSIFLLVHVVAAFSAFGRIIMHTGAMGTTKIFEHNFEQSLLPHTLHTNLLNKATANLAHNTSITRQYRKKQASIDQMYPSQDDLYYHLSQGVMSSNRSSSSSGSFSSAHSSSSNPVHNHAPNNHNNHNNGDRHMMHGIPEDADTPYRRRADSLVRFADEEEGYATRVGLVRDMVRQQAGRPETKNSDTCNKTAAKSALSKNTYDVRNTNDDDDMERGNFDRASLVMAADAVNKAISRQVNPRRSPPPPPPPPPPMMMRPALPRQVSRSRSMTTDVSGASSPMTANSTTSGESSNVPPIPSPTPMRSTVANVSTSSLEQWLQNSGSGSVGSTPSAFGEGSGSGTDTFAPPVPSQSRTVSASKVPSAMKQSKLKRTEMPLSDGAIPNSPRSQPPAPIQEIDARHVGRGVEQMPTHKEHAESDDARPVTIVNSFPLPHRASDLSMDDSLKARNQLELPHHFKASLSPSAMSLPSPSPPLRLPPKDPSSQTNNKEPKQPQNRPKPRLKPKKKHSRNPSLVDMNVDTSNMTEEERFLMDYGEFESPYGIPSSEGISPGSYYNLKKPPPQLFTYEDASVGDENAQENAPDSEQVHLLS